MSKEIVLRENPFFPFGKAFWVNKVWRDYRKSIYKFLSPVDWFHLYGHKICEVCATCLKKSNDLILCCCSDCKIRVFVSHNNRILEGSTNFYHCKEHVKKYVIYLGDPLYEYRLFMCDKPKKAYPHEQETYTPIE